MRRTIQSIVGLLLLLVVVPLTFSQNTNPKLVQNDWGNYNRWVSYNNLDARVTSNIQLSEALDRLEDKFDVSFMYRSELAKGVYVPADLGESSDFSNELLKLMKLLNLKFTRLNNRTFGISVNLRKYVTPQKKIQQHQIEGTVTDSDDGSALPGVNIVVKGTSTGTTTNAQGHYEMTVESLQDTLVFSYIGYEPQTIPINGRSTIDVSLSQQTIAGEELVVVGYGTKQKSLVTGSISQIETQDFSGLPISRAEEALEGKTAGVSVMPTSGSPGAGMKVRVRGTSSNQSSQPLYIVDGMKTGDINNISPSDIASIEVLKDAASAAIYGAEGANGVVLISTKSGSARKSEVTYEMQYGIQDAGDLPQPMNASQYKQYMQEAGETITTTPTDANTNWIDQTFQTAPMQRHYLSFSGGNETSTYMLSGSYYGQDGIVGKDKAHFERMTARLNTNHQIKDWLEVGNHLSYSNTDRSAINEDTEFGGIISNALLLDPLTPVTYDGVPPIVRDALDAGRKPVQNDDGQYYGLSHNVKGEMNNPLADIYIAKGSTEQDKVLGNLYARLNPIEELEITSRVGIDYASQLYHTWNPEYWFSDENLNTATSVRDNQDRWYTWLWENFAQYKNSYKKHNYTIMAGISSQEYTHKWTTTLSGPMFKEGDNFAQHGTVEIDGKLSGSKEIQKQASYYGRINYDYDGKYMLEASFRRDGSSLLADQNKWGNFPSFSAGWIMTEEQFWPLQFITFAKLRASWGQNGSLSNLSPDQYRALITSTGIKYPNGSGGFYTGAEPDILSNPELKWETSEQTDVGLDLRTLGDRLLLSVDYYHKVTKDLLTPSSPPLSVGNDAPYVNAGDVTNKGFEFELAFHDRTGDLGYDINFNLSTNQNEVTYLNPLLERVSGTAVGTGWTTTYFEEGKPIWYFRGYDTDGIFQNQAQIDTYIQQNGLTGYNPQPGDPIVVNHKDDGLINGEDMIMIGNPHPDMVIGTTLNFNYKGFDLGVFVNGSFGNDVLMGWNRTDRGRSNRPEFFYTDRWTGEGSTNDWFRADLTNPYAYNSDMMVFDGSYVRIRQIELGYTLPASFLSKARISNARIFVSLNNYFTFTNYPGVDPVAGSDNVQSLGIDRGVYPIAKKVMTGVSLSF